MVKVVKNKDPNEETGVEQLTQWFLSSVSERVAQIEAEILGLDALSEPAAIEEKVLSILSSVHSLKGSSGAHEISWIATACHLLEDELIKIRANPALKTKINMTILLAFLDLISKYAGELLRSGVLDEEAYDRKLSLLHLNPIVPIPASSKLQAERTSPKVLLIGSSTALIRQIAAWFDQNQMGHLLHVVQNSHEGLGRVYHEKFDLVITSLYTTPIDGLTLIGSIKLSRTFSNLKTILLTSDPPEQMRSDLGPDHVILKDDRMFEKLFDLLGSLSQTERLPQASQPAHKAAPAAVVPHLVSTAGEGVGTGEQLRDIIFIDDDVDVLMLARAAFQKQTGVSVRFFTDPVQAIESAGSQLPDLVVSDFSMPGMRGDQVVLALREHAPTSKVPVVIFSGQSSPEFQAMIQGIGALGLVDKRSGMQKALQRIRELWSARNP